MTAFGRAVQQSELGRFVAEVQSLNRKFLDISVQLPRELSYLEADLRNLLSTKVQRGKVSLKIIAVYQETLPLTVLPNLPLAKQLKEAWAAISQEVGIPLEGMTLEMFAGQEGILLFQENSNEQQYRSIVESVVVEALDALLTMKMREGEAIRQDFLLRLDCLKGGLETIGELSKEGTKRYQEKLKKRLEDILPGFLANDERILREVCIYAEKIDIAEEITRLDSHIAQFHEMLLARKEEKGKALEFILQEMHREINTIGSKSDDLNITKAVLQMKRETERLKEQVQNIE